MLDPGPKIELDGFISRLEDAAVPRLEGWPKLVAGGAELPAADHGEGRLPGSAELPKAALAVAGAAGRPKEGVPKVEAPNAGPPKAGVLEEPKVGAPIVAPVGAAVLTAGLPQTEGLLLRLD